MIRLLSLASQRRFNVRTAEIWRPALEGRNVSSRPVPVRASAGAKPAKKRSGVVQGDDGEGGAEPKRAKKAAPKRKKLKDQTPDDDADELELVD